MPRNLGDASLEELMNVEVTSVSKKDEKLSQTAAAIYVITQEDIRRSGATTIPDVLRMAPGLDVAQIDTNIWAVSARGFNSRFADKLLVLVDGRSVYSEIFSGTFWDSLNILLEDIDRIEVIRGPGATMWGANAVNGVINIITKTAKDTQGTLISAGGGAGERGFGELRYGGQMGSRGYYRAYANVLDRAPALASDPGEAQGDWSTAGGGFRMDWNASSRDSVLVEGNLYGSGGRRELDQVKLTAPFRTEIVDRGEASGGSLMSRWQRRLSNGAEAGVQISYEHTYRDALALRFAENATNIDFQYRQPLGERNSFVWGLGYRFTDLDMDSTFGLRLSPPRRQDSLFEGFVQDEWALVPDRVTFTVGSKFEHNPFTGFEIQPGMRLSWTPAPLHTFWVAVSRAVRTPAVGDTGFFLAAGARPGPGGVPVVFSIEGNPYQRSENLLANEIGYRIQPTSRISFDLATFVNAYDYLRSKEPGRPYLAGTPDQRYTVVPTVFDNLLNAYSYGGELAANAKPANWWKLSASYSWLKIVPTTDEKSRDSTSVTAIAHGSPQHQFQIRSYLDLPWRLQFDASLYGVSSLPALNVPAYVRTDARLGWRATRDVELSLTGQNLLNGSHVEFFAAQGIGAPFQMRRAIYGRVTWQF